MTLSLVANHREEVRRGRCWGVKAGWQRGEWGGGQVGGRVGGRGLTYANIFIVRFRRDIAVVAQLA